MPRIYTDQPSSSKPLLLFIPASNNSGFVNTTWTTIAEAPDFSIPSSGNDSAALDPADADRELRPGELFFESPLKVTNTTATTRWVEVQMVMEGVAGETIPVTPRVSVPANDSASLQIQGLRLLKANLSNTVPGGRLQIRAEVGNALRVVGTAVELESSDHAPDSEGVLASNELWSKAGEVPSLDLRFADTKSLVDAVTGASLAAHTRATAGTYVDSAGVSQIADANVPRFTHDHATGASLGLMVEPQRTNRIANATASAGVTIATGTKIGPDGNLMRKAIIPSGIVDSIRSVGVGAGNAESFTLASGGTIDIGMSGWFAAGTSGMAIEPYMVTSFSTSFDTNVSFAVLHINTSNWGIRAKVLGEGITEVQAPAITQYSPGVYRVTWVVRYTQGSTIRNMTSSYVQLRDTTGTGAFTGDGVGHFEYYGLQAATGSRVTSYIPTTTAAVTRAADIVSITGANFASWYRQDEGTLYAEGDSLGLVEGQFPTFAAISDGTNNNRLQYGCLTSTLGGFTVRSGGSTVAELYPPAPAGLRRGAFAAAADNFAVSFNGATPSVDASGAMPVGVNQMQIGDTLTGGPATNFNGPIRRLTFWPARLANSALQQISQ